MALTLRPTSLPLLDVARAVNLSATYTEDPLIHAVFSKMAERKQQADPEQQRFATLCDRWDNLYFPNTVLPHAGASHWAEHSSAHTPGKAHISVNSPPLYVDIPASLQSVPPIENMVATIPTDEGRSIAAMAERLYFAWKDEENWELKGHQACVVKGLYGHTAFKVYWDENENRPCVSVVDQPRNLYLGWGQSDYRTLNWALYCYRQTAEQVYEDWGLVVDQTEADGTMVPFVLRANHDLTITTRSWGAERLEVEVYDYWYRLPAKKQRKRGSRYSGAKMETWNAIFVGNECVKNEKHAEFAGRIPYIPLFNTYVPGMPSGRPELFDIEPLIREKDERMSAGAQMLGKTIDGQYWQLTGPEAPDTVPNGLTPKPNKVVAPGAGNRLEKIEPWMPEFQLETYLARIDREMTDVSGLNDLLRGLAPASVMSSSKAITALVANYEARIRMKRDLYYVSRRQVWEMVAEVWASKMPEMRIVLLGTNTLQSTAPSLTPRDDMETAAMTANLVNSKLWAQKRGMDRVGVDDPEVESDIIRAEQTDAAMNPAAVQTMAQLMVMLQSLGMQQPQETQMGQEQSLAAMREQFGGQQGTPSLNAPEEQPVAPPEALPANAPAEAPVEGAPELRSQTMIQEGESSGRILSESDIPIG